MTRPAALHAVARRSGLVATARTTSRGRAMASSWRASRSRRSTGRCRRGRNSPRRAPSPARRSTCRSASDRAAARLALAEGDAGHLRMTLQPAQPPATQAAAAVAARAASNSPTPIPTRWRRGCGPTGCAASCWPPAWAEATDSGRVGPGGSAPALAAGKRHRELRLGVPGKHDPGVLADLGDEACPPSPCRPAWRRRRRNARSAAAPRTTRAVVPVSTRSSISRNPSPSPAAVGGLITWAGQVGSRSSS